MLSVSPPPPELLEDAAGAETVGVTGAAATAAGAGGAAGTGALLIGAESEGALIAGAASDGALIAGAGAATTFPCPFEAFGFKLARLGSSLGARIGSFWIGAGGGTTTSSTRGAASCIAIGAGAETGLDGIFA